ncbi:DUF305 domain-containing protein [Leucobacter sp. USCH14]|uniref:DUF305 domain-containing protein n=1 Tax=Leucobacter chromiisoli TaxID=2796471 RepID=A0A934Q5M8_9MICO|nr:MULTISPECIES: DUF305 domain-containing protein [Actinomycetes]EYT51768.1 hypothetical protein H490_0114515 [Leucobacter sp. UCD-THU]MBK0418769.1 DUF305 domain-containing protein [Leucobacter chromiisoli]MDF1488831.1 DUF305 domain-containing protein [Tessaracoccus caeni]
MRIRTLALASAALSTALLLAGCSPSGTSDGMAGMDHGSTASKTPTESAAQFNAADQMFVTMMIPHHEQAIEMADMLLAKDGIDERVVALAQQIKDAQGPEIKTMQAWLDNWGVSADDSSTGGMDHGGGMMSEDSMTAFESATGTEATRLFLEGMIEHHTGAIEMAQSALDGGKNPDVLELAQQVIDDQSAEITTMQELLNSL